MRTLSILLTALTIFVVADAMAQDYKRAEHKFYRP
jgi:hypothetical protein